MENLYIQKTEDTPEIKFAPDEGHFEVAYRSLPENAIDFYKPIFTWLENYMKTPKNETKFDFKLEYFNTASAKQIAKLLLILERLSKVSDVLVRWHYDKEDSDMLASGKRYEKLIKLNFEFIDV